MDANARRIALRKSQILANLQGSVAGEQVQKAEQISYEEFEKEVKAGTKFYSPQNIADFHKSVKTSIINSGSEEAKSEIQKSSDAQLAGLTPVNVQTNTGQLFTFYKETVEKSEEGTELEKSEEAEKVAKAEEGKTED